ncbi:MAG: hypothetical protein IKR19_08345 [Acholeplasmatales bacterium]|nr:hypothetical protein [Acholeplasmatales bacterium]
MLTDIRMNDKGELEGRSIEAEWKVVDKNEAQKVTVSEAIKDIEVTCEYLKNIGVFDNPANEKCKASLAKAIDTMQKFQTMQEVLEKVWNIPACMIDKAECLNKIMETYRTVR